MRPPGPIHRLARDHKINWKSPAAKKSLRLCGALLRSSYLERNPSRQLSSCCILPLNVQLDGGRTCRAWIESMEGGHCSNLFELASGNKGAWPARSISRAMRATPSKSRTWAYMPPTFLRARTEALASADSQTALRGRTDLFSQSVSVQTLLFWILRVCAARSH